MSNHPQITSPSTRRRPRIGVTVAMVPLGAALAPVLYGAAVGSGSPTKDAVQHHSGLGAAKGPSHHHPKESRGSVSEPPRRDISTEPRRWAPVTQTPRKDPSWHMENPPRSSRGDALRNPNHLNSPTAGRSPRTERWPRIDQTWATNQSMQLLAAARAEGGTKRSTASQSSWQTTLPSTDPALLAFKSLR